MARLVNLRGAVMRKLLILCALLTLSGQAQAEPVVANGIWCNTKEQLVRLFHEAIAKDKSYAEGLMVVNVPNDVPKCAAADVLMEVGDLVERVEHDGRVYGIFQVRLLAVRYGTSTMQMGEPMVQYGIRPLLNEPAL